MIFFIDNCAEEWCSHCHDMDRMTDEDSQDGWCDKASSACATATGHIVEDEDLELLDDTLIMNKNEACGKSRQMADEFEDAITVFLIAA